MRNDAQFVGNLRHFGIESGNVTYGDFLQNRGFSAGIFREFRFSCLEEKNPYSADFAEEITQGCSDEGSSDEYSESSVAIMEKGSAEAKPKAQILANVSPVR